MNDQQDYNVLGGWLLVWYWGLIIGGATALLSMVIPALATIVGSLLTGFLFTIGILISIISVCATSVLSIRAAFQLKARNPRFFDSVIIGAIISLVGNIASRLFSTLRFRGLGRFLLTTISSTFGVAFSLCLGIMYLSKSLRVNVYFRGRPLPNSQFWSLINLLPPVITSDIMG